MEASTEGPPRTLTGKAGNATGRRSEPRPSAPAKAGAAPIVTPAKAGVHLRFPMSATAGEKKDETPAAAWQGNSPIPPSPSPSSPTTMPRP